MSLAMNTGIALSEIEGMSWADWGTLREIIERRSRGRR